LKREIKNGQVRLDEVLREPPGYAVGARVEELLVAVPRVGPSKRSRLLRSCGISGSKTVGGLSERQRQALIDAL
jgi:hypothetical protein